MRKTNTILLVLCLFGTALVGAQTSSGKKLTTAEAKDHIGETATVCGRVASTHHATSRHTSRIFIDLDAPPPHEVFTIVIWGSDRSKFGDPEGNYRDKKVCVTGKIASYQGVPQIIASEPSQIAVQK
jgi:hypothetical protein